MDVVNSGGVMPHPLLPGSQSTVGRANSAGSGANLISPEPPTDDGILTAGPSSLAYPPVSPSNSTLGSRPASVPHLYPQVQPVASNSAPSLLGGSQPPPRMPPAVPYTVLPRPPTIIAPAPFAAPPQVASPHGPPAPYPAPLLSPSSAGRNPPGTGTTLSSSLLRRAMLCMGMYCALELQIDIKMLSSPCRKD